MDSQDYPIIEFDPDPQALMNPERVEVDVPPVAVICFFHDVIEQVCRQARRVYELESEFGNRWLYDLELGDGRHVAVFHPGVGSAMAAGAMEEAIACGVTRFVGCGSCGVLDGELAAGHVVIGDSAIRDEGTSYHYLPPAREVTVPPQLVESAARVLTQHEVPHRIGKVWTTAAPFRETRDRVERRRAEGAMIVDMEAAAFLAVAQFRGCDYVPLFYAGDAVIADRYDDRGWQRASRHRHRLFHLATQVALDL